MDRGLGLSARLNVLPKSAWCTSYSSRVTRRMNRAFLKKLNEKWVEYDLLSDTANLDFTTVPYWGDDSHPENNRSGKRNKALPGILAVLAQDPDSGIITYGDTNIRHKRINTAWLLNFSIFTKKTKKMTSDIWFSTVNSQLTRISQNLETTLNSLP